MYGRDHNITIFVSAGYSELIVLFGVGGQSLPEPCISQLLNLIYALLLLLLLLLSSSSSSSFDSIGHVSLLFEVNILALFIGTGLSVSVKNSLKD